MVRLKILLCTLATLCLASCLENDIPYPTVEANITNMTGDGFTAEVSLAQHTVTLHLDETTDIRHVRIRKVFYNVISHNTNIEDERFIADIQPSRKIIGTFDMNAPIYVSLSLYGVLTDWTIVAEQHIERRFRVAGQIGAAEFDPENFVARAYVGKDADRTKVDIQELKLGPADITTYSPSLAQFTKLDFSDDASPMHFIDVTYHNRTEKWAVYVQPTDRNVSLDSADAWSKVVWLRGTGLEGATMGFRYSLDGNTWREVDGVTVDGGSFTACFNAEAETTYQFKAYCNDDESEAVSVTTEGVRQLPNSDMEAWSKPAKPWLPYAENGTPFWATGNHGSTTLGDNYNVSTPDENVRPGSTGRCSAKLQSTWVALKLAAGNIFVGEFAAIRGVTHGVVNFGRPFTLRPTALRVWVRVHCGVVDHIGTQPTGVNLVEGQSLDQGSIYIALGTWTKEEYGYGANHAELFGTDESPVSIDTRDIKTFFDAKSPAIIGYGERIFTESAEEWQELIIPIEYRSTDERPTHIIVTCSSSRWGDYFTGSSGSWMYIDDIELLYDYTYLQKPRT